MSDSLRRRRSIARWVGVDAHDLAPRLGECDGEGQPDVPEPDDPNLHGR